MDTVKKDESWREEPLMIDLFKCRLSDERREEIRARVSWVGPKHGVILGVSQAESADIQYWITYHYGQKSSWWKKMPGNTWAAEFVYTCDGPPRPTRPWHWDGKTVLFQDWQEREKANRAAASNWHVGDKVRFYYRGGKHYAAGWYEGVITARNKMAGVVVPGIAARWHILYEELEKVED